jgi:class 3 adenylate cyclase
MDVAGWLRGLDLGQYEQAFRENDIATEILPRLTAEDLIAIGVSSVGHRRVLLDAIAALASKAMPAGGERRQLSVMFCDLVGSTTLAARLDPEDLGGVMGAYYRCVSEIVGRYASYVAKYMGDGVLVYFGYPQAHEDDAERAVRAGLELCEAVSQLTTSEGATLALRVGIDTGLVVVGDLIGEGAAQERAVLGETPNLAARLQTLAQPGWVVIGPGTHRLVAGLFDLGDLGSKELKGFGEKVQAWQVVGERRLESRFAARSASGLTPFVGRQHELALLLDRFKRAKDGEGQVVLLSGEPGIGKSRLAHALLERLADEPHTRLRYYCSPFHVNTALYPIIEQLERAAAFEPDDRPDRKLDKLEALLDRAPNDMAEVAPLFAALLSIDSEGRYGPLNMPAQCQRELTIAALVDQLARLSARQPVLMVLEDSHWLDPSSTQLFERIIERVQTLPVLLLVTFRPEFTSAWTSRPYMKLLTLSRLGQAHGTEMIAQVTGGKALPEAILAQI